MLRQCIAIADFGLFWLCPYQVPPSGGGCSSERCSSLSRPRADRRGHVDLNGFFDTAPPGHSTDCKVNDTSSGLVPFSFSAGMQPGLGASFTISASANPDVVGSFGSASSGGTGSFNFTLT